MKNQEKYEKMIYKLCRDNVEEMTSNSNEYYKNEALKYISEIFNDPLTNIEYNTHIFSVYQSHKEGMDNADKLEGWKQYVGLMKGVYGVKEPEKESKTKRKTKK